ncbi:hypothetical protein [Parasphingorhabdus cellanae]|uniref:Uncharacterized protein n=1 Tax=Parasphingorhabdus cellanae TaxID=2806553 RepID=A0ABX7SZV9_9SPHN|nr:hypothetical protein [Parasphingorhabdus cellanae]QTD54805.1 hypothetical protein J4G78_11135 [Parasphingorhabdus cellanae]
MFMRNRFPVLTMLAFMLASTPATAQQASQSGARTQVTASARIIGGESIRFGATVPKGPAKQGLNGKNSQIFPLARTRGEILLKGGPHVLVTEFH